MALLDTIKRAFGAKDTTDYAAKSTDLMPASTGALGPYLDLRTPGSRINFEREAGTLWMSSLVMPLIGWIARTFPEAPPVVMVPGADGEEMERDHPALALLDRPNLYYTGDDLFAMTILSGIVDGNAYWLKERGPNGGVRALYYVPHWAIEPYAREGQFLSGYRYRIGGREMLLPTSEVIHFRHGVGDPKTLGRTAISPLRAQLREIATDNEAAAFTFASLKNHGFAGGILAPDPKLDQMTDEQRRTFKRAVMEQTTGENRGGWMVLSNAYKYDVLGHTPDEMSLDKIRTMDEARVCAAIGVSTMVLGFKSGLERSTYSNKADAREGAYEECIIPLKKSHARALTEQLLRVDFVGGERLRYSWDWSGVRCLQEDETDRVKRYVLAAGGPIMSVNEARAQMGWDAIEGQDEIRSPRVQGDPQPEDPRSEAQKLREKGYNAAAVDRILSERRKFDVIPYTEQ